MHAGKNEGLKVEAEWEFTAVEEGTGKVLWRIKRKNLVVNKGKEITAKRLTTGSSIEGVSHCAVGTGTTAAVATDTTLQTEFYRKAVSSVTYPASNQITFTTVYSSLEGNNYTWAEFGLFNASSSGDMFNRVVLASPDRISKTTAFSVSIAVTVTVS